MLKLKKFFGSASTFVLLNSDEVLKEPKSATTRGRSVIMEVITRIAYCTIFQIICPALGRFFSPPDACAASVTGCRVSVTCALLVVFTYLPLFDMVGYSFFKWNGTSKQKTWIGLNNYIEVFTRPEYLKVLKTSIYYFIGSIVQIMLALFFATILNYKIKPIATPFSRDGKKITPLKKFRPLIL